MKKALIAFGMLLMTGTAANAGALTHKLSSSVQLTVDAAATRAVRVGNSYSVSGNGVTLDVGGGSKASADYSVGGLGTLSSGVAPGSVPTAYQTTDGTTFSFSNSFTAGDAIPSAAVSVGDVANFGDLTSTAAGTGTPTGTIATDGAITVGAGGAGTSAIGQFVSEVSIFD